MTQIILDHTQISYTNLVRISKFTTMQTVNYFDQSIGHIYDSSNGKEYLTEYSVTVPKTYKTSVKIDRVEKINESLNRLIFIGEERMNDFYVVAIDVYDNIIEPTNIKLAKMAFIDEVKKNDTI